MNIEIIKGDDNPVAEFFSSPARPTPETDALDCELHTPRVLQDRYSEMRDHAQKLERERNYYKWQLHIAKGEIAEARKMEIAWKKEKTK